MVSCCVHVLDLSKDGRAILHQEERKRSRSEQDGRSLQRHESGAKEVELDREEVIRRLRLLGQPVTLFGEVGLAVAVHVHQH